jgi:serine/threonine-protein kinase
MKSVPENPAEPAVEAKCPNCGRALTPGYAFCSHCGASVTVAADTGDKLLARLRVLFGRELEFERELGRGGMAVVYSAFDRALERRVAVKSMLPEIAANPDVVARFLREARTVASLQHPHVVSVFSVRTGDGVSAIVMQFVEGRSLDLILRERAPLPLPVAAQLLTQIAGALQHAHDRGVIHRDVKPANVLIDRDGNAVVSDFGIARRDGNTRITGTGMLVGTMAYMSPEQLTGREIGPASDQYAFGVMAFELLAGRRPFAGSMADLHEAHLSATPPSLRQFRPDVPPGVEALVLRMLKKDPAARHPNLRDIERAFRALIPDSRTTTLVIAGYVRPPAPQESRVREAVTVAAVAPPAPGTAAPPVVTAPVRESTPTVPMRRGVAPRTRAAAAAAVLLAAALAIRAVVQRAPAAQPAPAPVPAASNGAAPAGGSAREPKAVGAAPGAGASSPRAVTRAAAPAADSIKPVAPARGGVRPPASGATQNALSRFPASDSAAAREPARAPAGSAAEPAPAAPRVAAALADARAVAREFVTMLNQRRWRELEQLASLPGDAPLRTEVVRLTHSAQDFSAGFERVASPPEPNGDAFLTECVVDLQWRGGHRMVLVHLKAQLLSGAWHLAGFGTESAD